MRRIGRRLTPPVRRRAAVRGRRKGEPLRPKELRQLAQLVVCGGAFVALVAVKLLLPARMERLDQALSAALARNMDVQAVFSAVGRSFSGAAGPGETVESVVRSVFHPEAAAKAAAALTPETVSALDSLRSCRTLLAADAEKAEEADGGASNLAYVLYSDQNVPADVSLEQAILGFDYCTPVSGVLSSPFGYREHPLEGEERFHYGVDLAADSGSAICAFAAGTVTAVGESSSYGKYCIVDHGGGYSTLYAHCSQITASSGAAVERGQKIAEVGETGIATGPHLHFELHRDGLYLNPVYYVSAA